MKSGVYRINCNQRIYIGSSINTENRLKDHLRRLRSGKHTNRKMQFCYNKYGESAFTFYTIERCDTDRLIHYEQIWLDILFSSLDIDDIFNTRKIAESNIGIKMPESMINFTREFHKGNTYNLGRKHGFESRMINARSKSNNLHVLVSPDGIEYTVENIRMFCENRNLDNGALGKVIHGKAKHHKGWTIKKND